MHADLLEQPSAHDRRHAAAAGLTGMVGAVPGGAYETPGLTGIEHGRRIIFQSFEGRANVVAQTLEPGPRPRLAVFDHRHVHLGYLILRAEIGAALVAAVAVNADPCQLAGVLN